MHWSQLTVEAITNLFLYGEVSKPIDYNDRIRTKPTTATVSVDGDSYMASGPGRYALDLISQFKVVQTFFYEALHTRPCTQFSLAMGREQ
jgi:hypothetical protein